MGKRRNPEPIQRLLGEADRDLAKGLTQVDQDPGRAHSLARRQVAGLAR
jgi:hypothetical protein